jgi:hypothetical protein
MGLAAAGSNPVCPATRQAEAWAGQPRPRKPGHTNPATQSRPPKPGRPNMAAQTWPSKPGRPNNAAMRAALDFRLRRAGCYLWMKPGTNAASYWLPRGEIVASTQNDSQNAGINR